jgi:hypothetical protein
VKASLNIQLVRIGLMISVDWEHVIGMGHIAPVPTTCPVTQVGHTTVVSPFLTQLGEIGSAYPEFAIIVARGLQKPHAKSNQAPILCCSMMFNDLLVDDG